MHDVSEVGPTVPAFLAKLWKIVNDEETDNIICWGNSGSSFVINNSAKFTQELLPMYFKHNNLASFMRQLNMYGFHKQISTECGGLKSEKDYMEFSHTCFVKGVPYLLENIKRKQSSGPRSAPVLSYINEMADAEAKGIPPRDVIANILNDVNTLKKKQASWDAKLAAMKRENETLWRELAIYRQKHHNQEKIINKLIRFMVANMVPPSRTLQLRRRYPLMLQDVQHPSDGGPSTSSGGPTIREIDPAELLLADADGNVRTATVARRKSRTEKYSLPHLEEELAADDAAEFISPKFSLDNPYVVVSPEQMEAEGTKSPWLTYEADPDDDLTAVSPLVVNPSLAMAAQQPGTVVEEPRPVRVLTLTVPQLQSTTGTSTDVARPLRGFKRTALKEQKLSDDLSQPKISKIEKSDGKKAPRKSAVPKKATRKNVKINKTPSHTDISNELLPFIKIEPTTQLEESLDDAAEAAGIKLLKVVPPMAEEETVVDAEEPHDLDDLSLALVRPGQSLDADEVTRDLGDHVDSLQSDLDILREFIKNENCSLDASALLDLFDDPLAFSMPPSDNAKESKQDYDAPGNELMTFAQPSLLDLVDMYAAGASPGPAPTPCSPSPSVLETPVATPLSPPRLFAPPSLGKKRHK